MNKVSPRQAELKIANYIGVFLKIGVSAAGFFLVTGWAWMLIVGDHEVRALENYESSSLAERLEWAVILNDRAMIFATLGLTLLVLLPLVRVFMTVVLFAVSKDYKMTAMAFFVLLALIFSFSLGIIA
jgi:uncharacterized membrane protein